MSSKPNSISTQAEGVFLNCGPGVNRYELQFTCKGPACTSISGFQNVKCNPDGGSMSCSNDFKCPPGIASFQSNFTFQQNEPDPWKPMSHAEPDSRVQQQQRITLPSCAKYSLTSDGTKEGTKIDDGGREEKTCPKVQETPTPTAGSGLAKKTSSSSVSRPQTGATSRPEQAKSNIGPRRSVSKHMLFITFLLGFMTLLPGTYASSDHFRQDDLRRRARLRVRVVSDKVRAFAEDFSSDLAEMANAQGQNGQVFAHNLVADVISSVCDEYFGGTRPSDFTPVIISSCMKSVYGGERLAQPAGQFFAVFGASLLCDYVISEAYPVAHEFFPDGCEGLQDLARKVSPTKPVVSNVITPVASQAFSPIASLPQASQSPASNQGPTVSPPAASIVLTPPVSDRLSVPTPLASSQPLVFESQAPSNAQQSQQQSIQQQSIQQQSIQQQSIQQPSIQQQSAQQQSVSVNRVSNSNQSPVPESVTDVQPLRPTPSSPAQSNPQLSGSADPPLRTPAGSQRPIPSGNSLQPSSPPASSPQQSVPVESSASSLETPVNSPTTLIPTEISLKSSVLPPNVPPQSSQRQDGNASPLSPSPISTTPDILLTPSASLNNPVVQPPPSKASNITPVPGSITIEPSKSPVRPFTETMMVSSVGRPRASSSPSAASSENIVSTPMSVSSRASFTPRLPSEVSSQSKSNGPSILPFTSTGIISLVLSTPSVGRPSSLSRSSVVDTIRRSSTDPSVKASSSVSNGRPSIPNISISSSFPIITTTSFVSRPPLVVPSNSSIVLTPTTRNSTLSSSSIVLLPSTTTPRSLNSTTPTPSTPTPSCQRLSDTPNFCPGIGCVDFMTNNTHCGGCQKSCTPGLQCYKLTCLCPGTLLQPNADGRCNNTGTEKCQDGWVFDETHKKCCAKGSLWDPEINSCRSTTVPPACPKGMKLVADTEYCCPMTPSKRASIPTEQYYLKYCTCLGGARIEPVIGCNRTSPSSSTTTFTPSTRLPSLSASSTSLSTIPPPSSPSTSNTHLPSVPLSSSSQTKSLPSTNPPLPPSASPRFSPTPSASKPSPSSPPTPLPTLPPIFTAEICPRSAPHTCSGTCVNTFTDPSRCGSCNNACSSGWSCSSGGCWTAQFFAPGVRPESSTPTPTPAPAVSFTPASSNGFGPLASGGDASLRPLGAAVTSSSLPTPTPTPTPTSTATLKQTKVIATEFVLVTLRPSSGDKGNVGGVILSAFRGWW